MEPSLGVLPQLAWSIGPTATCIFLFFFFFFFYGLSDLRGGAAWLLFVGFIGAPITALVAPVIAVVKYSRVDRRWKRIVPRDTLCLFSLLINIVMVFCGVFLFAHFRSPGP
jgi:hypothetical protein